MEPAATEPGLPPTKPALWQLVGYFLRLGALGFGGPVVLANHMQADLVGERGWLTESEYLDGLALATACPGPLAFQLGVYCGYIRFGVVGALAVAVAFAFTPFLIVTAAAALYVKFAGAWEVRAIFYGVAPVITALILKACWQLGRKALKTRRLAWLFAAVAAAMTVTFKQELISVFIIAGLLGCLVFAGPVGTDHASTAPKSKSLNVGFLGLTAAGFMAPPLKLFAFFFKMGLFVFGSGLVIAPFLKVYVVDEYHWLTDRQFIDAVAIGMVTPGPVVITATFVGYVVDGFWGGLAATAGIFSPAVLFTIVAAPLLKRYRSNRYLQGFLQGIISAVVGALLGTTIMVAQSAIEDALTVGLAVVSLGVIFKWPKIPEFALVIVGASIGLLNYYWLHPAWV